MIQEIMEETHQGNSIFSEVGSGFKKLKTIFITCAVIVAAVILIGFILSPIGQKILRILLSQN
jgi:hypothetical protein